VNSTLTDNPDSFPLGEKFYVDFSHDDIIISALTAMSLDYIKDPPSYTEFPPRSDRRFVLSRLTPFGARLITEVIGCGESSPAEVPNHYTIYSPGANGYNATNATSKFIRMRLNNGILPLSTIRGGNCEGRTDGLCALESFIESQDNSTTLANYQYSCFGNYTIVNATDGHDYDGTIFE
jgi:hypothetical protein